jgi:hypothetical protein
MDVMTRDASIQSKENCHGAVRHDVRCLHPAPNSRTSAKLRRWHSQAPPTLANTFIRRVNKLG